MITFHCDGCGHEVRVKDALAGRKAKCPKCGAVGRIPAPAEDAPSEQPAPQELMTPDAGEPPRRARQSDEYGLGPEPTRTCPSCGKDIPIDARSCEHCSRPVVAQPAVPIFRRMAPMDLAPASGPLKKILLVGVPAAAVLVALILAGLGVWGHGKALRIVEANGGFSYLAPYGWTPHDVAGFQYKVLVSPTDMDGFHPTIRIAEEEDTATVDNFCTSYLKTEGFGSGISANSRRPFTTAAGMYGARVNYLGALDKKYLNHVVFFFGKGNRKLVITCSSPPVKGDTLDGMFDECMKTFRFDK